ncbi:MAG: trehalose-6-phosphate synthase [Actinomycetota bacterium]
MREGTSVTLASNRGPVSFVETQDGFDTKRGAGGLAGALDPVARSLGDDAVWISATNSDADRAALHAGAVDGLAEMLGYPVYLLDIDADTYARYYDQVSNRMLWFANHCLWDELGLDGFGPEETDAFERFYEPVNKRFAEAVCEVAAPDGFVLFQDYHLYTAPGHLRALRPDQVIFHFTHSSFCSVEGLDRLPRPIPQRVIEGMLGADLLGFHVAKWVHGFLDCAEQIGAEVDRSRGMVEYGGRVTWVREYPIQVDTNDLLERVKGEKAQKWAERFRNRTHKGPLLVRADRTEPSKNIVRGFEAFGKVLDRRPDIARDVHFAACVYPSRQSMPEYKRYTERIIAAANAVNARHPDAIELFMEDDFDRTLGALLVYDVLVVNSIMDGMNLVSKEGPVVNENDGVLVLSEGAGSFEEMGGHAIGIHDALNVDETADAIERALDMSPEERRSRSDQLRRAAQKVQPEHWIEAQLDDLEAVAAGKEPLSPPC